MSKKQKNCEHLPIKTKWLIRILVLIIVVLAYLAGYYQSALKLEKKKYLRLENNYVRVRQMLGREKTQELIDESYYLEENNE